MGGRRGHFGWPPSAMPAPPLATTFSEGVRRPLRPPATAPRWEGRREIFWCLLLGHVVSFARASTYDYNFTSASTRLRRDVFGSGYDAKVAPNSNRIPSASTSSTAGTDVDFELRIFKITKVELTPDSTLEMLAWVRQSWYDDRLAWDPEEYGGLNRTYYAAKNLPSVEDNEIWTPDFTIYNAKVGLAEGFEGTMAQVDHTGRVYWSRPGILSAYCKFSGILNFPFDNLKCKVEIGGWMLSGAHQGLSSVSATLDGTVGDNGESTSKPSYADYNLTHASAHIDVYEYPTDPQNPYPVMMINLELKRVNSTSWFWIVVMPMAALTYLAMFAAFIPIESGERLGYGITMLVAVEVNKMVLVGVVPIAGEILQLEILTFFSALFCYLALLQSFVIMFLYRHGKKHLMPKWMTDLRDWCTELCCNKEATADGPDGARSEWDILKQNRVDDGEMDDWDESGAAILYRAFQHYAMRSEQQLPTSEELDDLWDLHFQTEASGQPRRKMFATDRKMFATGRILSRSLSLNLGLSASLNSGLSPPPSPPAGDAEASEDLKGRLPPIHIDPAVVRVKTTPAGAPRSAVELEPGATEAASIKTSSRRRKLVKAGDTLDEESIKRLMLFEKLFFDLDTKVNGCVEQADLTRLLSYLCLDWSYKERKEFADSGVVDDDDDNKISRAEFLEVCLEKLWDYDTGILEMAITNFKTAQALVKQAPNRYWRRVVSKVDRISQFWMPLVYTVIIVVCYHLTLHDGYDQDIAMWNGMNYFKVTMTPQQVITILVVPLIGLSIWCFYFRVKKRALKQMKRKLDKQLLSAQEQVQLTISRAESSFERGSKEEYAAKFTRKSIFKKGTRTPKASENKIMAKNWLGRTLSQTSSSAYPPAV